MDLCARDGLSPMMIAAAQNPNPQITQLLFEEGGDPYSPKRDGWTVLMLAAGYNGNPQVLDTVLDMGVDVHARDHEGRRAMDFARLNRSIHSSPAYTRLQQLSSLQ